MRDKMNNPFEQVVGYKEIRAEIEVLSKYGDDFTDQRGEVNATVDLYHPKVLNLRVSEIIDETPLTKTLRMVPENGYLPPFQAGHYVNLFVETQGVRSSRPYSIASPQNQGGRRDSPVKLKSGKVFHAPGTRLRKSGLQFGYIHPCMAYPLEELEILL